MEGLLSEEALGRAQIEAMKAELANIHFLRFEEHLEDCHLKELIELEIYAENRVKKRFQDNGNTMELMMDTEKNIHKLFLLMLGDLSYNAKKTVRELLKIKQKNLEMFMSEYEKQLTEIGTQLKSQPFVRENEPKKQELERLENEVVELEVQLTKLNEEIDRINFVLKTECDSNKLLIRSLENELEQMKREEKELLGMDVKEEPKEVREEPIAQDDQVEVTVDMDPEPEPLPIEDDAQTPENVLDESFSIGLYGFIAPQIKNEGNIETPIELSLKRKEHPSEITSPVKKKLFEQQPNGSSEPQKIQQLPPHDKNIYMERQERNRYDRREIGRFDRRQEGRHDPGRNDHRIEGRDAIHAKRLRSPDQNVQRNEDRRKSDRNELSDHMRSERRDGGGRYKVCFEQNVENRRIPERNVRSNEIRLERRDDSHRDHARSDYLGRNSHVQANDILSTEKTESTRQRSAIAQTPHDSTNIVPGSSIGSTNPQDSNVNSVIEAKRVRESPQKTTEARCIGNEFATALRSTHRVDNRKGLCKDRNDEPSFGDLSFASKLSNASDRQTGEQKLHKHINSLDESFGPFNSNDFSQHSFDVSDDMQSGSSNDNRVVDDFDDFNDTIEDDFGDFES